jgi:cobyric acid synthase
MLDLTVKGRFGKEMSMIQGVHRSKNVSGRVFFSAGHCRISESKETRLPPFKFNME